MKNILVSDIMTREPNTIKPGTNLLECSKIMVRKNIGSLIITDGKKNLLGFISRRDILWALVKKSREDLEKIMAMDISPRKIATIRPEATISDAISRMKSLGFERLPVVERGKLVGVITVKDILNFHPEIYPELEEFARIKEESEKLKRVKMKEFSREAKACERCGKKTSLQTFNGMLVCESCINSV